MRQEFPAPEPSFRFCPACSTALESRVVKPGDPPRLVCPACDAIHYRNPKLSAGVIVEAEGRLLLGRRGIHPAYGKWVFPGGFVERGERTQDAATREAREEQGVDVAVDGLLGVYSYTGVPVVLVVYHGRQVGGRQTALDETLAVRAVPPPEVPWAELAYRSTHDALRDYVRMRHPDVAVPAWRE